MKRSWAALFFLALISSANVHTFDEYDTVVTTASAHGVKVIALVTQYGIPPFYRQDSTKNAEDNFGLLRFDYTAKPSYATMSAVRADYNAHFTLINP
jgi:hypothetical protein